MLENYLPDRKAESSSSMSLSPGEGSSSLFSLHKRCFQITHICKTKANRRGPNIQMNIEIQTQEYQCFPMMTNGFITYTGEPYASTFTHVFNMMKSQHFNHAELSLGPYLLVISWLSPQHHCWNNIMWSVKGGSKYITLSSSREFSTHGSGWGNFGHRKLHGNYVYEIPKYNLKKMCICVISGKCSFLKWTCKVKKHLFSRSIQRISWPLKIQTLRYSGEKKWKGCLTKVLTWQESLILEQWSSTLLLCRELNWGTF